MLFNQAIQALAFPERAVHRSVLATVLVVVAVSNGVAVPLFLLLRPPGGVESVAGFLLAALPLELFLIVLVALSWRLRARCGEAVRWPALARIPGWVLLGVLAGPLLLLIAAVGQAVLREALGVEATQLEAFLWIRMLEPWGFVVVLLVAALAAPLAEELFFRGFVFRAYLRAGRPLWGYLVSASVFALLHLNVPAAPPIFAMGLLLTWLYHRTGSVVPGVVAHGFNNTIAFLALYLAPLPM